MIKAEVFTPFEVPGRVFSCHLSSTSIPSTCCRASLDRVAGVPGMDMCSQGNIVYFTGDSNKPFISDSKNAIAEAGVQLDSSTRDRSHRRQKSPPREETQIVDEYALKKCPILHGGCDGVANVNGNVDFSFMADQGALYFNNGVEVFLNSIMGICMQGCCIPLKISDATVFIKPLQKGSNICPFCVSGVLYVIFKT